MICEHFVHVKQFVVMYVCLFIIVCLPVSIMPLSYRAINWWSFDCDDKEAVQCDIVVTFVKFSVSQSG